MPNVIIRGNFAFCNECAKDVQVSEKPGDASSEQTAFLLVCAQGHVVGTRESQDQPWRTAAA
jgi:hypothetical protein